MADGSRAPVIGLSAYCETARWRAWDTEAVLLPRRYADSVAAAGGVPVLLPPVPGIEDALARLDGLLLSGGGDIDPARYGAEPDPRSASIHANRDTAEFALIEAATARRVPVLGICRGLQVINVARGGTLHQHLPDVVGHEGHAPAPGVYGAHPVRVSPGSRLSQILGGEGPGDEITTPTSHHQAVDKVGAGLTATAWAQDGTIEALEPEDAADGPFLVAVQWHPEAGDDPRLFRALVAAAREHAAAPAPA
jgi:putative glutamine amidotransferase